MYGKKIISNMKIIFFHVAEFHTFSKVGVATQCVCMYVCVRLSLLITDCGVCCWWHLQVFQSRMGRFKIKKLNEQKWPNNCLPEALK